MLDDFAKRMGDDFKPMVRENVAEEAIVAPTNRPPGADPTKEAPPGQSNAIVIGSPAGLARRQAARLERGEIPIEARLDLHGCTRREARGRVARFLARSAAERRRCVLIVTGQGRDGRGVLKERLQTWLNVPATRPLVLACMPARPKDGGAGAFYVLLRRFRQETM